MADDAIRWEMRLRGAVAGLLLFHIGQLALPGARPAARAAPALFTRSVLAKLFCQQAEVLLGLPRLIGVPLLAPCTSSTAWMRVAARALFDDHFAFSATLAGAGIAPALLGSAANLPHLPEWAGSVPAGTMDWLTRAHALAMLGFTAAARQIGQGSRRFGEPW